MTEHSPTPWVINEAQYDPELMLIRYGGSEGPIIAEVWPMGIGGDFEEGFAVRDANAEHIARCVNLHDELVAACKLAVEAAKTEFLMQTGQLEGRPPCRGTCMELHEALKACQSALDKAQAG